MVSTAFRITLRTESAACHVIQRLPHNYETQLSDSLSPATPSFLRPYVFDLPLTKSRRRSAAWTAKEMVVGNGRLFIDGAGREEAPEPQQSLFA